MAKYVSKEFSILNARKFKDSVASTQKYQVGNSTILYAVLGRNRAYTDENNPDTPIETDNPHTGITIERDYALQLEKEGKIKWIKLSDFKEEDLPVPDFAKDINRHSHN